MFSCIFSFFRDSKLDEVTGRTEKADGLVGIPATQPPLTTPPGRRDIPPQLSMTLELIVGQLDVLTHFWRANISEQGSIVETKSLGGGMGCTPVEEVEEGPMLGGKKQKSLSHSKVYTYKPRINIHFKTPVLKQDISLRNGRHGFGYLVFATIFYQSLKSMDSFSLNQAVFFWREGMVGKHYNCSFSFFPLPLKRST